jgi:hypothetical protein
MTLTNERLSEIIKIYNKSEDIGKCELEDLINCKILDVYHHDDLKSETAKVIVTKHKVFILDHNIYNGGDGYYSCTFMSKFKIEEFDEDKVVYLGDNHGSHLMDYFNHYPKWLDDALNDEESKLHFTSFWQSASTTEITDSSKIFYFKRTKIEKGYTLVNTENGIKLIKKTKNKKEV